MEVILSFKISSCIKIFCSGSFGNHKQYFNFYLNICNSVDYRYFIFQYTIHKRKSNNKYIYKWAYINLQQCTRFALLSVASHTSLSHIRTPTSASLPYSRSTIVSSRCQKLASMLVWHGKRRTQSSRLSLQQSLMIGSKCLVSLNAYSWIVLKTQNGAIVDRKLCHAVPVY